MAKAVIFDVDGTLLDTERLYMEAWRQAGLLLGYTIPYEALLKTRAVSKSVSVRVFQDYLGEDFPYDAVMEKRLLIGDSLIQASTAKDLVKPGVEHVLRALKTEGYRMAVASSTNQSKTRSNLERAGLLDRFSVVIGGDMVIRGKPEPDIFLLAAEKLKVAPSDCIVVGDTPADVFAAHAAGMRVYLIPDQVPANEQTEALSQRVLEGMDQLLTALNEEEGSRSSKVTADL